MRCLWVGLLLIFLSGSDQPSTPWPILRDRFISEYFALSPAFAAVQGRHEFDGRLPDWSERGSVTLEPYAGLGRFRR